jgi:hypothetical protein
MKLTDKQIKEYAITSFDEDEDIILPDNIFAEILYILYVLFDILKRKGNRNLRLFKLRQQIYFYIKWLKNV